MEDKKNKETKESSIRQILAGNSSSSKKKIKIRKKNSPGSEGGGATQSKPKFDGEGTKKTQHNKSRDTNQMGDANKKKHGSVKDSDKHKENHVQSSERAKKDTNKDSDKVTNEQPSGIKPILPFHPKNDRNPIVSRPPKSTTSSQETNVSSSHRPKQHSKNQNQEHKRGKQQGGSYSGHQSQSSGGFGKKQHVKNEFIPPQIPPESTPTTPSRKRGENFDKERSNKNEEKSVENAKFFKQTYKKNTSSPSVSVPKEISIMENIQVGELAKKLNLKPGEIIAKLMKMGMMVTINNIIDSDTAILVADEYGCKVKIISLYEETVIQEEIEDENDYIIVPPVVTIMGHVDHGKTKLLDAIRNSTVIDSESGGITQHIGAYQVKTENGKITFIDTPGHEAFTAMRARGASVTNIVVLVVAADDGVMPQTIEAINHSKAADVPIIVAINKIDLPAAKPEKVMQELASYGLQPEEWGGTTIFCNISAKQKIGIEKLLEMILLQAEVMELKSNPKRKAKGTIVEARLDPGRGSVATVLIQNGTLRVGDAFLAGIHAGRVRAMYDDKNLSVEEAEPSCPVLVTGLDGVPEAGDPFDVVKDEKEARSISQHRMEYKRINNAANIKSRVTLDTMNEMIQQGQLKELKIIIKADVRGSAEAIKEALEKLSTSEIRLNVIHAGTGAIVDTDVMLASASNALIVGFHVRANPRSLFLAEKEGVQIKYYNIIYEVVDEIKSAMEGLLEPEKVENVVGKLEIRNIFKISKLGNIAGCMVTSGKIHKSNRIRVLRDNVIIHDGDIRSLKREKDDINEVQTGFECGVFLNNFNDFVVGDELEVYEINTIARKL